MLCIVIFINSCSTVKKIEENLINKTKSSSIFLNFDDVTESIIIDFLKYKNMFIFDNSLFFVNVLKNDTNNIIDTKKLTNIIKYKISKNTHHVHFITDKTIKKSKKKLGLSNITNLTNISTAILLSRNNHVKYYLESYISGDHDPLSLTVKLILVETGEIIFLKTKKFYL